MCALYWNFFKCWKKMKKVITWLKNAWSSSLEEAENVLFGKWNRRCYSYHTAKIKAKLAPLIPQGDHVSKLDGLCSYIILFGLSSSSYHSLSHSPCPHVLAGTLQIVSHHASWWWEICPKLTCKTQMDSMAQAIPMFKGAPDFENKETSSKWTWVWVRPQDKKVPLPDLFQCNIHSLCKNWWLFRIYPLL